MGTLRCVATKARLLNQGHAFIRNEEGIYHAIASSNTSHCWTSSGPYEGRQLSSTTTRHTALQQRWYSTYESFHVDFDQTSKTKSTTVICVRKGNEVVLLADGQVTLGSSILKPNVRKTRKIGEKVIGGFAGATADAFTLFERLEGKLEEHPGQLTRAAVELAKMWRMDKYLRRLDASLIVADKNLSLQITGNGDVLEPHDGIISIGSGSPYALAAARALIDFPELDAMEIAKRSMDIAADSCIYTNSNFSALRIGESGEVQEVDLTASDK